MEALDEHERALNGVLGHDLEQGLAVAALQGSILLEDEDEFARLQ